MNSTINSLVNDYAEEFTLQNSSRIIIEIIHYKATFTKYMEEEFPEYLDKKVYDDLIVLAKEFGFEKSDLFKDTIREDVGNKIKDKLYQLIKTKVYEEIQKEVERLEYFVQWDDDKESARRVALLKAELNPYQHVVSN